MVPLFFLFDPGSTVDSVVGCCHIAQKRKSRFRFFADKVCGFTCKQRNVADSPAIGRPMTRRVSTFIPFAKVTTLLSARISKTLLCYEFIGRSSELALQR